jgi:iron(III) transport system permease protein
MTGLAMEALDSAGARRDGQGRGARAARPLVLAGVIVGVVLVLPLLTLMVEAGAAGWTEISAVLFRPLSATLLLNTLLLPVCVTPLCAVIGTGMAWLSERSTLPGRRLWTVILVLPVAMPDFVVGYAWHTIAPGMSPLGAATMVMTLASYPLVYLPVAAALRRSDPGLEEISRGLGVGAWATFFRVTLPPLRPALTGGCLVVVLTLISEFGAFEIVRFQTFTTEIFTEFQFNPTAAAALSLPLVLLGLMILTGESLIPRRPAANRATGRTASRTRLGATTPAVLAGLGALAVLAVGVPIGTLAYWMASSQHTTLPAQATLAQATGSTVAYCSGGAALAVILALPIAFLSARSEGRLTRILERSTYLILALPGVVVALSLVFFTVNLTYPLYETSGLLVVAYGLLTFPLALSCLTVSVRQAPAALTSMGRSLGRSAAYVFFRVTVPLIAPGLIAGFCLVFLTATTELTATLVLAPIGTQTLTTQFWAFQSESAYGAAAPYALVIIALSMIPGALLALWFDRGARTPAIGAAAATR